MAVSVNVVKSSPVTGSKVAPDVKSAIGTRSTFFAAQLSKTSVFHKKQSLSRLLRVVCQLLSVLLLVNRRELYAVQSS